MNREKIEEAIASLAETEGLTTKTIRLGDLSIVLGLSTGEEDDDDNGRSLIDKLMTTPAPVKGDALVQHLKEFEKIALDTSVANAKLGSHITRTIAKRSLGDELDQAVLRCAVERYESERLLHAAIVRQLELVDPLPQPRTLLMPITFDHVMTMLAAARKEAP